MTENAPFAFQITHKSTRSQARCGLLNTPHGTIETPAFIFCATKASLKGLGAYELPALGTQIILSNTYHLMLRPGAKRVAQMGGLHNMMHWKGPMLTDSGGFQVFSLGHGGVASEIKGNKRPASTRQVCDITEEGVVFSSYLNGDRILLTPETSMDIQQQLGADLIVAFDECTPFHVPRSYTEASTRRSMRWAERCVQHKAKNHPAHQQALYGVIQGGVYPDLRQESAQHANTQPFFGQAIGGSLGSCRNQMTDVVACTTSHLDKDRPTHLLGIGHVQDIQKYIGYGIDTFDCVHPTRLARHGGALVHSNPDDDQRPHINLKNAHYANDLHPIDDRCACPTCKHFSRGYLHHLLKAEEILGPIAITRHNVFFMNRLMESVRTNIRQNLI